MRYPKKFCLEGRGRKVVLPVDQIDHVEARDGRLSVYAGATRYTVTTSFTRLLSQLDPDRFVRIHRSVCVNRMQVQSIRRTPAGRQYVVLRNGRVLNVGLKFSGAIDWVSITI
jgi:two-component system LytT family response regulator